MTHFRLPISLVALCGVIFAAAGARSADAPPPASTAMADPAAAAATLLDLPGIETLTAESDFTTFMRPGVPPQLRQRALRKLWSLDPQFANVDELGDYADDYSTAETRAFAEVRRRTAPGETADGRGAKVPVASEVQMPDLAEIDTLTGDSDFAVFMTDAAPAQLRHRALRKLWSVDPRLATVDGLGDYNADYTVVGAAYVAGTPVQMTVQLGTEKDEFIITPAQLRFDTNERYELVVANPSDTTHYFSATQFGASVTTQKAVLYDNDRRFVKIWLNEERPDSAASFPAQLTRGVKIRPGGAAHWIFTPTQAGQFDFGCAIAGHKKQGMVGSISVGL